MKIGKSPKNNMGVQALTKNKTKNLGNNKRLVFLLSSCADSTHLSSILMFTYVSLQTSVDR